MTKKELRTEIKSRINALSHEYKIQSSETIARFLISSPAFIGAKSIFIYASTENEPDTALIIETALKTGKEIFVPVCVERGVMLPVKITPDMVWKSGYMGIPEPSEYDEDIRLTHIDLSVIPCVSASLSGERLGHGAGFYDRYLCNVTTKKFCLCFSSLLSSEIPTDEHDIKMDAVITEKGIIAV